jgi:F0F1-type ATP synthase assembly protein I
MLGTFFTIDSGNVSTTIGYVSDLISDTSPMWILIIGVGLGLIVFEVIVNAIRGRH